MNQTKYICPNCGSDNTSSFGMIFQGGTSTGNFKAVSYGLNTGVIGTGGKTKNQSMLAQQTAPPQMPRIKGENIAVSAFLGIVCGAIISNLGVPLMGFIVGLMGFAGMMYYFTNERNKKMVFWKQDIQQWNASWMCLKCGNSWIVQ